ncbi:STP1 protein [Plasmodium ovale curtisi]|uniref:STP1 protein n=1 Tax=Plasmodium ovale curtisi TaxID=864141 RepID=A0A1A8WRM7_PLAOA|nr:STP1 protein [Plasmodium ovale curtisi]
MADNLGYTTITHGTPVDMFFFMIKSDIKKLIHTHGHKNCGLRHEELCKEIQKVIAEKKKIVFSIMDERGKQKWNNDWNSQKKEFFNNLFAEEGFINMCFPKKFTNNPSLYELKSKHIQFCKKRDVWKAAVKKNNEYNECVKYNKWIETERTSFTHEYLDNAKVFRSQTVNKYFSTKEYPRGHDPRGTYLKSKLDCTKYNPPTSSHSQRPTAKDPPNSIHPSTTPDVTKRSKEKNGKSVPDVDSESSKTKPDENMPLKPKLSTAGSRISPSTKTETDDAVNGEKTNVKAKGPVPTIKEDGEKKEGTSIHLQQPTYSTPPKESNQTQRDKTPPRAQISPSHPNDATSTPVIQHVSSPTGTTTSSLTMTSPSSLDSVSPSLSDPIPPAAVTKDQDRALHSTTTSDTLATTHSTETLSSPSAAVLSLAQPQSPSQNTLPAVTATQETRTPVSSIASTVTTTVTTTTTSSVADTSPTMSTTKEPISSIKQVPSTSNSQESPPPQAASEPKITEPTTEPQQKITRTPTPLSGSHTGGVSDPTQPVTDDVSKQTSLPSEASSEYKDTKPKPGAQLTNDISQTSGQKTDNVVVAADVKLLRTINQTDSMRNISPDHTGISRDHDQLTHHVNADLGKIPSVKQGKYLNNNSFTQNRKNDNPNIISEGIPPLMHIIPPLLVILATITLLFQLYKYTPFGLFLGRRRKRKKHDLKRIFEIPEKCTYEYPNITEREMEDPNLVGQTQENDVYVKLLKINWYKQEMQKRKKKNKTTLIEVHMEVLEEHKKDEWELHKGDFLEICLRGFINEENETYQKFSNSELIVNNIKNEKTIEDIQKQEILWNNWIENHRNILEQWKEKEWFHILKNKWRNEQQKYKEKNYKLQENILNEQETHSIVSQKDIWKRWISKQATLIDMFNKEDWFKSMVYVQDREKNNYHVNEYKNTSITSQTELKNEKTNYEHCRRKNIIQKLMVQIHMMVLEECIKDDFIKHKELCIDNFIEDIHNQNNYDEKRNILQCDTDDFDVLEFQEIQTSRNK